MVMKTSSLTLWLCAAVWLNASAQTQLGLPPAHDLGVRAGSIGAGQPLSTLSADELQYFQNGMDRFNQVDSVRGDIPGEPGIGLGPTFNANSCGSCHAQPAVGGSSPAPNAIPHFGSNPQIAIATIDGAKNSI